ncbi:MAG TPA: ABC transporter permease [Anaerolineales bacterium]|nr:ABC transporter permease [Anaerolineales bacterium]
MISYLARRLLQLIAVVFGIAILTFILIRLIPGDPCRMNRGQFVPMEVVERCRIEQGLHLPVLQQFIFQLGGLFSGDTIVGQSMVYHQSAMSVIADRLPVTLLLVGYASTLTVLMGLLIGLGSALKPGSLFDTFMNGAAATALTLPSFLIGTLLILVFSLNLRLFPTSGYSRNFLDNLHRLFLPALTLAISNGAMLGRVLRRSMLNVMSAPFILTARAKGISNRRVFAHHVFRNGLISPVTLLGLQISWLLSGSVVVETVFALPGMGSLLVQSVLHRDYAVIQLAAICFAVMVAGVSLLADVIYPALDPRVRNEYNVY